MLSRKDYEKLAAACRETLVLNPKVRPMLITLASSAAEYFASDNPRFDKDRFAKACNLEGEF
jgi:hypothetical protein